MLRESNIGVKSNEPALEAIIIITIYTILQCKIFLRGAKNIRANIINTPIFANTRQY